jgi:hypothetical protein
VGCKKGGSRKSCRRNSHEEELLAMSLDIVNVINSLPWGETRCIDKPDPEAKCQTSAA